ncbi:MAG: MFS transporter [Deltaproteobacteria bacterium]|nr:MFS transporter [Deltaproteobacteria bacterium]MBW2189207.1 MFS transporter [Deltaproteobacteria bacterium]MBW2222919.1 MFS transporter [Deltaproteobacteria bacterium]MBW2402761.1 MFS transporter [Deltaproteobacteria bacterium]MBW2546658.1 MFS transporter [Deltaproteobacteria bacterium]
MADPRKPTPLAPVLLVNFIGTLGFTIVIPFLVFLVTRFGGNALVYGLVAATYPAFQFLAAPVLGRWSDRYGRRRILLLSEIGTLLSWLIFAVALFLPPTELFSVDSRAFGQFTITVPLAVIFAARALDGLTGGNISVANAYVADVSDPQDRNRNFGRMGVAANMGMIMGPALASVLGVSRYGEVLPVFAAAIIALVGVFVIAFRLPESRRFQSLPECPRQEKGRVLGQETRDCIQAAQTRGSSVRALLSEPNVFFMMVLYFTIFLAFNFYYTAFPIHAARGLGWDVVDIGAFFATLSVMIVVVEGPILSRLAKRFSEPTLIMAGLPILGTNFILMQSSDVLVLYIGALLFAVGNGLMWPSVVSMVSKVAPDHFQGAVQGIAGSAGSLASVVGLILGGMAYNAIGVGTFLICAGIAYGSFLLSLRLPRIQLATAN